MFVSWQCSDYNFAMQLKGIFMHILSFLFSLFISLPFQTH